MDNKNNKNKKLTEFFESDPTDRLPLLTDLAFDDGDDVPSLLRSQALASDASSRQLDEKLQRLERENDELSAALERERRETEHLNAAIAAGRHAVQSVTRQLYETQEELDAAHRAGAETDALRLQLEAAEEERARGEEQRDELQRLHADHERRAELVASELREQLAHHEDHTQQLEAAREQELAMLEASRNELHALSKQRERLSEAITQRDEHLRLVREQLAQAESERRRLVDVCTAQSEAIQHMKDELKSRLEAISAIDRDFSPPPPPRLSGVKISGDQVSTARHVLVGFDGDEALHFPLGQSSVTIGRSADNDIRIRRDFISRHHARIDVMDNRCWIQDVGSKNGVLVNAVRVERAELNDGDLVDFGELKLRFCDTGDAFESTDS